MGIIFNLKSELLIAFKKSELKKSHIVKMTGLNYTVVCRLLKPNVPSKIEEIEKIANFLGYVISCKLNKI